jgi:two-component system cell cycle sensor histidine kinase/response regulator CckA
MTASSAPPPPTSAETAARLAVIVESAAAAVIGLSLSGIVDSWNPAAERIFGYGAEEIIGQSIAVLFLPEAEASERALLERVEGGERFELYVCVRRRKNGSQVDVGVTMAPVRDSQGRVTGSVHIARNFSERKRLDAVLLESEERFRGAFDFAATGMALIGADGRFLRVNQALSRIVGYTEGELLESTYASLTHPEELDADQCVLAQIVDETLGHSQAERRYRHKDGHFVWVLRSVALVRDSVDEPLYFIVQVQDISGQKEAEEQLRQAQKMQAIGQLAGGVAHDFNNLLTVIAGYADCLGEEMTPDDARQELVAGIGEAVARAAMLTQQLLLFSRKAVVKPEVVNPNDLVRATLKMLERLIGEDVTLTSILSPAAPSVRVDPRQIEQVIMNLAINARDAMPQGGRLTIETNLVHLEAGRGAPRPPGVQGPCLELTVSDTGVGMSSHVRAHLFEPFFTTKGPGKGTGLGLAAVYGVVEQGGGFLSVESEVGSGSSFHIFLPAVAADRARSVPPDGPLSSPRGLEVVLVVEDEDAVRRVACTALKRYGFVVLEARSGPEAIQVFEGHPGRIDVLLTDVVMPGMNGRQLAEVLRSRSPGLKVLFMSGYNDDAVIRHGISDATEELLQKPFTPRVLAKKLRDVLDGSG